jgi:hypothetical protein
MMEANDMLLWTIPRDRIRVLPLIEFQQQIEEFHLTAAELYTAQQGLGALRTVVEDHL